MDGKDLLLTVFGLCVLWGAYGVLRPLVGAIAKRIADGPKREGSADQLPLVRAERSEERRVGKECSSRRSRENEKRSKKLERETGIEPQTCHAGSWHSTPELL